MIIKLSLVLSGAPFLICHGSNAGFMLEFTDYTNGIWINPCGGFNNELGFKMRYDPGEVDDYDNEIKLKKEN